MEGEISNCLLVWTLVVASLCYCHASAKFIPRGTGRFLSMLPVVCLFLLLPLRLTTISLRGLTSFFIALQLQASPLCIRTRALVFLSVPPSLSFHLRMVEVPPVLFNILFCVQVNVSLELSLALVGDIAQVLIGAGLEPQFIEPYLSTSLQDFWGRRWNLMVTNIMHPTIYEPVRSIYGRMIGRKCAALPATFSTFLVSALMHELIFYYIGQKKPTRVVISFLCTCKTCAKSIRKNPRSYIALVINDTPITYRVHK